PAPVRTESHLPDQPRYFQGRPGRAAGLDVPDAHPALVRAGAAFLGQESPPVRTKGRRPDAVDVPQGSQELPGGGVTAPDSAVPTAGEQGAPVGAVGDDPDVIF